MPAQPPDLQSQLWPQMQSGPAQTSEYMTGGLYSSMRDMQTMQQQFLMQNYLRAYSQAMPGVTSPTQQFQDPTVMNYMLQNMYMMNPYMSNFLSGAQGSTTMGLAPPYMMTSPRMGVFRDTPVEPYLQSYMRKPSLMRDWATMSQLRTYSPYESPLDEQIDARRRVFQRAENLAAGAMEFTSFVGPMLLKGSLGTAAAFASIPADIMTSAYMTRREETEEIYNISKRIATGAQAGGFRNRGFALEEAAGMMRGFRQEAARSPFFNMADYMSVLREGTNAGVFAFQGSAGGTEAQVKNIVKMIDTFMRLAGDPDIRSAMERMGRLQTMGLTISQMPNAVLNLKAAANLAGTTVDQIMSTTGAYGAQIMAQMGGPAIYGMQAGATAQAGIRALMQSGQITPMQAAIRGGEEGMAQSMTQIITNTAMSNIGTNIAAFSRWNAQTQQWEVNRGALRDYTKFGTLPGQVKAPEFAAASAYANMAGDPNRLASFQRQQMELTAEALQEVNNPIDQALMIRRRVERMQGVYGLKNMPTATLLRSMYGENWREAQWMISPEYMRQQVAGQFQASQDKLVTRLERERVATLPWNRALTGMAAGWENLVQGMVSFTGVSRMEQEWASQQLVAEPMVVSALEPVDREYRDRLRGANVPGLGGFNRWQRRERAEDLLERPNFWKQFKAEYGVKGKYVEGEDRINLKAVSAVERGTQALTDAFAKVQTMTEDERANFFYKNNMSQADVEKLMNRFIGVNENQDLLSQVMGTQERMRFLSTGFENAPEEARVAFALGVEQNPEKGYMRAVRTALNANKEDILENANLQTERKEKRFQEATLGAKLTSAGASALSTYISTSIGAVQGMKMGAQDIYKLAGMAMGTDARPEDIRKHFEQLPAYQEWKSEQEKRGRSKEDIEKDTQNRLITIDRASRELADKTGDVFKGEVWQSQENKENLVKTKAEYDAAKADSQNIMDRLKYASVGLNVLINPEEFRKNQAQLIEAESMNIKEVGEKFSAFRSGLSKEQMVHYAKDPMALWNDFLDKNKDLAEKVSAKAEELRGFAQEVKSKLVDQNITSLPPAIRGFAGEIVSYLSSINNGIGKMTGNSVAAVPQAGFTFFPKPNEGSWVNK